MSNGPSRDTFQSFDTDAKLNTLYDMICALQKNGVASATHCDERYVDCDERFKKIERFMYKVVGAVLVISIVVPASITIFGWVVLG